MAGGLKGFIIMLQLVFTATASAKPECSIEFLRVTDRLGVIAGKAKGDRPGPVYVSVNNANLIYTTNVDPKGNWAVTFRYFSPTVTAEAWQVGTRRSVPVVIEVSDKEVQ